MLTFVNLSGGDAYDGYIIPKILGHNGASTNRTVLTQGQILQHLRAGANEGAFANLHVTGDITAGHDDGKASEFYVVADGGEKVNDGELAGDYAGSENATRGDDGTATKIIVFTPGDGLGMDEDGEVNVFILDAISNALANLRIGYCNSER